MFLQMFVTMGSLNRVQAKGSSIFLKECELL